jgi:hypothetical protein
MKKSELLVTKDDVARLVRGKPSKSRCGSRQIRHRLRLDELERLAVARGRGYLLVNPSTRTALKNAWFMDCVAASRRCFYVEHTESGYCLSGLEDGEAVQAETFPVFSEEIFSAWLGRNKGA